ncbi:DUF2268 domain-containing protein [Bacillus testis]|uniref:DUF2268 domain-containing protein n=1 Tax=Bacillus testis TaxID=1622072 RepID=UPI00067F5EE7|nr:DUF2268 domain-containing putative Zn-dependent protease [Bacillus testis]
MGVEETYPMLIDHAEDPVEVARQLKPHFKGKESPKELLRYFQSHGMYHRGEAALKDAKALGKENAWEAVEKLFISYRKKWGGPDIPVFILPHKRNGFFSPGHHKSGLAFPDKLLLFLSPNLPPKELEALFVHEYHHVCRLQRQKKAVQDYSLGDSSVLEGCAEYAVSNLVGEAYLAPWTKRYTEAYLKAYWKNHFKEAISIERKDKRHDQYLLGNNRHPYMIGYSMGYYMVQTYAQDQQLAIADTLSFPSEVFIKHFTEKIETSKGSRK